MDLSVPASRQVQRRQAVLAPALSKGAQEALWRLRPPGPDLEPCVHQRASGNCVSSVTDRRLGGWHDHWQRTFRRAGLADGAQIPVDPAGQGGEKDG